MPIQGVVEDTFSIGAPDDMEKYFNFYEKQILDVNNLEQTNSPWCVAHATLRDATHCKKIFPENLLEEHLRRQQLQLQKRQDICFERLAPCMQPRNHYCRLAAEVVLLLPGQPKIIRIIRCLSC